MRCGIPFDKKNQSQGHQFSISISAWQSVTRWKRDEGSRHNLFAGHQWCWILCFDRTFQWLFQIASHKISTSSKPYVLRRLVQANFSEVLANGKDQMPYSSGFMQESILRSKGDFHGFPMRFPGWKPCCLPGWWSSSRNLIFPREKNMRVRVKQKDVRYWPKIRNLCWSRVFFWQHVQQSGTPRSRHNVVTKDVIVHTQQMLPEFCWNMFQHLHCETHIIPTFTIIYAGSTEVPHNAAPPNSQPSCGCPLKWNAFLPFFALFPCKIARYTCTRRWSRPIDILWSNLLITKVQSQCYMDRCSADSIQN